MGKRKKKQSKTCRHYRAWVFYLPPHDDIHTPRWCPDCGAIRCAIFVSDGVFEPRWKRPINAAIAEVKAKA